MSEVKKTWVLTTLNDVQERLEALIQTLEKEPAGLCSLQEL